MELPLNRITRFNKQGIGSQNDQIDTNKTPRSTSRKVLGVRKLKQTFRDSITKTPHLKTRQKGVTVKQIHLKSGNKTQFTTEHNIPTSRSSKTLLTAVKRRNSILNQKRTDCPKFNVINKPQNDPNITPQSIIVQNQCNCSSKPQCQLSTSSTIQNHQLLLLMSRPKPDIHTLTVQKRQIKILTSHKFNQRRSKDHFVFQKSDSHNQKIDPKIKKIVIPPSKLSSN